MKFWTLEQLLQLMQLEQKGILPSEIVEEMKRVMEILDTYYGKDRDVEEDDGGYILLQTGSDEEESEQYQELFEKRRLREGEEEYCDILRCQDGSEWQVMLFLVTNEYGVTVIRKSRGESN